jgi:hypothetical protein
MPIQCQWSGPLPDLINRVCGNRLSGDISEHDAGSLDPMALVADRRSSTSSTAIRVAEVVMLPFRLLAQLAAFVVVLPIVATGIAIWGLVVLVRALLRPMLYALGVVSLLATGAAGGYLHCAYQGFTAHPMHTADTDDQGAPSQTQIPAPITQGQQSPASGPMVPTPQADPFGLKTRP